MALLEVCCGSLESVDAAVAGGASRVELCASLELDGLTPPPAWIRAVRHRYPTLTLHVLIRPRAGDFVYSEEETDVIVAQAKEALEAGADGIVAGCLTPSGEVDLPAMRRLLSLTGNITFHRAFDVCRRPFEALEQIIGLGCRRILTSGQAPSVVEGTDLLRELRKRAGGRILILPGGGVTPENAARVLLSTGCTEIHGSASEIKEGKKVTSAAMVAALLQTIRNMKPVSTPAAPAAIGPYSQAVDSGIGLVFVSGQLPIDPATGAFPEGGVEAQTRQSLCNAKAILEAAGLSLGHVVKTTVFLADMGDFVAMNGVYAEFFSEPFPARSAVAVKTLPKGALVEVECIASRN